MLLCFGSYDSQYWPGLSLRTATQWLCDLGLLSIPRLSYFFSKNVACNLCFMGRLCRGTKVIDLEVLSFLKPIKHYINVSYYFYM